ncbi:MAG: S10 family peptidase [Planctomycetota bacterium]|jgi:carboxypeptidase C (cathepsin A)
MSRPPLAPRPRRERTAPLSLALLGLLLPLLVTPPAPAQAGGETKEAADPTGDAFPRPPEPTTTEHTIRIGGAEIPYLATAGTLTLRREDGSERGHIFSVSYLRSGIEDTSRRPVTFVFNGGPGSSSVWLHLGMLGPRRVVMDDEGFPLPPPGRLVDNEHSLLDVTDLVFIDPVMTGYSRPAEGEEKGQFHGFREDVESVAEFIRLWTTRHERWDSPKFLCGESYGTTRAAGLAGELQGRHGMYLNGLMLVSSILQFQTARFDVGNDLPSILFLPTYTATAWYHGQLAADLQEDLPRALAEAEEFALGDYTLALMRGSRLEGEERERIAGRLARLTGLSEEFVLDCDLRPSISRFVKELRRDEGITVGRLDSRFRGRDRDDAGERYEFDPSYAAIQGPYTSCANAYLREELGYAFDMPYEILSERVRPWSYANVENEYLNVAETLRRAMEQNPALHVHVANGYYDLATPYFATHYTFDHLSNDPAVNERVTMSHYESGHMMYIQLASLAEMRRQLLPWLEKASGAEQ